MITDLALFVQLLSGKSHSIIVYIDYNEAFIRCKVDQQNYSNQQIWSIQLSRSIDQRIDHQLTNEGLREQIYFLHYRNRKKSRIRVLLMYDIAPSDQRAIYLDFNLIVYLKDPNLQSSINTRLLYTKYPVSTRTYKTDFNLTVYLKEPNL